MTFRPASRIFFSAASARRSSLPIAELREVAGRLVEVALEDLMRLGARLAGPDVDPLRRRVLRARRREDLEGPLGARLRLLERLRVPDRDEDLAEEPARVGADPLVELAADRLPGGYVA